MSWNFRLNKPATFKVLIKYTTDNHNKGSKYSVSVAGQTLEKTVQFPKRKSNIYTEDLTTIKVPAGQQQLVIKPVNILGDEVMKLFEIDLVPLHSHY
jgi:hypothetical protein